MKAVDVALATSAAPTYLPSHRIPSGAALVDGGIWANNPVGVAAVEAVAVLKWPSEQLRILSLGCVEDVFSIPERSGLKDMFFRATPLIMQGQSKGAIGTAKLLSGHTDHEQRLYRYCPSVGADLFKLDGVGQIRELQGLGEGLSRKSLAMLRTVFLDEAAEKFLPCHVEAR